ncbi:hypothetical protein H6A68_08770, partial [Bifidobacterium pullorum subsp. saeculare]|uniref:hypothetical protein n=1 Tax=Bifidobacterium pullorum TaxID=78448 RepID=UPI00195EFB6F
DCMRITKKELLEKLAPFPDDAFVVALWDGGWYNLDDIEPDNDEETGADVLVFDCSDHNSYGYDA